MTRLALTLVAAFLSTLAIGPIMIPWLKKLKFGQNVRSFGPATHQKKQGVPTMGGIMMCLTATVCALAFSVKEGLLTVMLPSVGFVLLGAAVGFADDSIKIIKKRSLGLRARDKTWMLLAAGLAFALYCYFSPDIGSTLYLPFSHVTIDLGWWYIPFSLFVSYATINSANLLDGVDGMLSSVTLVICSAFTLICFFALERSRVVYGNMMVLSAAGAGVCLGFLLFNKHPAKVFMGDTGSFALGALVTAVSMVTRLPLWIPLVGIMYVVTAGSDILQVLSYKLRGKALLRMAPLHHHLELGGMKEPKIVLLYSLATLVMGAVALLAVM